MTKEQAIDSTKEYREKATTLCAFSNAELFVDGDLDKLKEQAEKQGVDFYILKGELKNEVTNSPRAKTNSAE